MSRIFLSHSSANNAEAIAIRDRMRVHGWDDAFLDLDPERGLKAGERWQDALKRAAERCEMVIFLVSPVWAASKWCLAEFLLAKSLNKRIFALIVEPTPFEVLPVELTAEWQVVDLTAGTRDYATTVALPPGDKTAKVAFASDGLNRLRIGLRQAGVDAGYFDWPPANDPNRTPYRGLRPLEADDAGIFFGRDAAVIGALDGLRGLREAAPPRLLVILGASGAGKSSFLRAGLIPRLARDNDNFFVLPIIRPERAAITGENGLLHALEGAFKAATIAASRADLRSAADGGASTLRPMMQRLADKVTSSVGDAQTRPRPPTLVLAIDQGEELFLAEGQDEARIFLALMRDLMADDAPSVIGLFTIRSDNYERLQLAKELDGVRQVTRSLPPMPKGACAEVIKGPAKRLEGTARALKVDDALVQALLTDIEAGGAKDSLPLLAFTLERLYSEYCGGGHLKAEHYDRLGGIEGSIEAAVEQAFKAGDADPKIPRDRQARLALLRRGLIPWVAGIDPDTGAPRRRVARLSEIPDEARPLMDLLVDQRLLSTDVAKVTGEKTVEPAHEALLRQWGLLQGWLKEDTALLGVMDGVKRASRDWAANAKGATWLTHTTDRLRAPERLLERQDLAANLEPTDRNYLKACRDNELAGQRKAHRLRASFAFLTLLLAAACVAWLKRDVLDHYYRWHIAMGASVLAADEEKKLAAQPNAEFAECKRGCPHMVVVPAGKFMMGTAGPMPASCGDFNLCEEPQHEVTIMNPFAISKTEVTFAQWYKCVDAGACREPEVPREPREKAPFCYPPHARDDRPVIQVSWQDAVDYTKWLSNLTGQEYRLPSEAQWEYAARAGSPASYSFGDDETKLDQYAWFNDNSGNETHPVGKKKPNAFGLYDMHGNVLEWVEDHVFNTYEGAPADGSTWLNPGLWHRRIVRGGSWKDPPDKLRSASRDGGTADGRGYCHVGFRVGRTLKP